MNYRLYYQICKTQNKFRQFIKQQSAKYGIKASPSQMGILFLLKENNYSSMSYISTALDLDNAAITRSIDKLEKLGFVKRQVNYSDRREFTIEITNDGLKETQKASAMAKDINEWLIKRLGIKKITILNDILKEIETILH
ncbi:MAG: MarR family transcriptional regulator [Spirochaetes bacterium]|nr:MarR family transcriptional regulator [Spirochaetota bacterium]